MKKKIHFFKKICSLIIVLAVACSLMPTVFADNDGVISVIDFENATKSGANVVGTSSVGGSSFTIVPANAGKDSNLAKADVVELERYESYYPGVQDSRMGSKALMFSRSGQSTVLTRWNNVFDLSKTTVGTEYEVSVWVYTADIEDGGSKEGTSALRFFVSKGGKYDSADPSTKNFSWNKEIPDQTWTKLSFTFEMTKAIQDAGANSFRMDSGGTAECSWAKTIFADNFTISEVGAAVDAIVGESPSESKSPDVSQIKDYDKIEGKSYETAVSVLYALGVLNGNNKGEFEPDRELTRAELLTIVLRTLGITGPEFSNKPTFYDVTELHWAYNEIGLGEAFGIVSGDGNGYFRPDSKVSAEETIKMIIAAIDYDELAESNGGYPSGYTAMAAKLGIYDNVHLNSGDAVLRWQCAQLLFNALDVELLKKRYISDGISGIEVAENQTILTKNLKAKKIKGLLTAVPGGSIAGGTEVIEGYAQIDNVTYKCNIKLDSYLGKNCVFYLRLVDDEYEIIYCYEYKNDDLLEIDIDDIVSVTADSESSVTIRYTVNNREKTFKFTGSNILYNMEAVSFATQSELQTFLDTYVNQGTVRIVKNDAAESMFIDDYKAYVVSRVSELNEKIYYVAYGKASDSTGVIELLDKNYKIYNPDGQEITLTDLKEDNVISVYRNLNDDYTIYVSRQKVTGTIEGLKLVDGNAAIDWQPPVTSLQYVNKVDADYSNWSILASDASNLNLGDGSARFISLVNGASSAVPSGYSDPGFAASKISISDMASETVNSDTSDDELYNAIMKDENGNIKTSGYGIKQTATAGVTMLRVNNLFSQITPGTVQMPIKVKFKFDVYFTDIHTRQGVADSGNAVSQIPVTVYLRSGNSDVSSQTIYVPVNKWTSIEPEWQLSGNVSNIHGLRMNIGGGKANVASYTNPFPATVYYSGNIQYYMEEEVTTTPPIPPETCKYEATIDGNKYYVADTFPNSLLLWSPLGIGSKATFLLDHEGRIAGYVYNNAQSGDYGMILKVIPEVEDYHNGKVRILTSDGKVKDFECDEKISAFDGSSVVKRPLSYFITDSPSNSRTDWYIWSNNNDSNFQLTPRTWLTPENKSKAASRKLVYYKTNSDGLITQILVPSMPLEMQQSKIKMLRDFNCTSLTSSGNAISYRSGYQYLTVNNQRTPLEGELNSYKISDNILVFKIMSNEYNEEDYTVISLDSLIDGSYPMQVYSFTDGETADAIVLCPQNQSSASLTNVMFDYFSYENDSWMVNGYTRDGKFSCKLPEDLRILERLWYVDNAGTTKLTRDNVAQACENSTVPTCYSYEALGTSTPSVKDANLKQGDIIAIDVKNGAATAVEVVSRVDDGIGATRSIHVANDISSMLDQGITTKMGVVSKVDYASEYIRLDAYVWTSANFIISGQDTTKVGNSAGAVGKVELWYKASGVPVTIYEAECSHICAGSIDDIEEGDEVIVIGRLSRPSAIFVWK